MAGSQGCEAVNVAFVYRHKMTSEVLVVDIDRARELDAARPYWQHVSTVDPIIILQLIVKAKGRARTKIIKELSEKP
jgi:DNA-binding protein